MIKKKTTKKPDEGRNHHTTLKLPCVISPKLNDQKKCHYITLRPYYTEKVKKCHFQQNIKNQENQKTPKLSKSEKVKISKSDKLKIMKKCQVIKYVKKGGVCHLKG